MTVAAVALLTGLAPAGCTRGGPTVASPAVCATEEPARTAAEARSSEGFGADASLQLDKRALRRGGASADLLAKLDRSAFHYFRLLARPFEERTCLAFRDLRWQLPVVPVHGDAHLEQFVVTHDSYGLEDFDDAGYGPAVVDLVRYAASIHLACDQLGSPCDEDAAVGAFFDAYRDALDQKREATSAAPAVVERLRSRSPRSAEAWLDWADQLTTPLSPATEVKARAGWVRFMEAERAVDPSRPPSFYEIEHVGVLRMGFGSALERKVLFRARGATNDPSDDLILEARASSTGEGGGCIEHPAHGGAMQVFTFMSTLGRRMPDVFGFVTLTDEPEAREYWVQSWDPGYAELSIADIRGQSELEEVVRDAATQLAGSFWTRFPERLRGPQRHVQLAAFDHTRERAVALAAQLAGEVTRDWTRFRQMP